MGYEVVFEYDAPDVVDPVVMVLAPDVLDAVTGEYWDPDYSPYVWNLPLTCWWPAVAGPGLCTYYDACCVVSG